MKNTNILLLVTACVLLAGCASAPKGEILFNGKNLEGFRPPTGNWQVAGAVTADETKFKVVPGEGVLVNGPDGKTVNLITMAQHGDVEAHIEFCLPKKSNSGVYFQGRYEVQVYDSYGVAKDKYPGIECGGIYPRWTKERGEFEGHSPRVNASLPPGQWQAYDVIFRAPRFDASGKKTEDAKFVKVVHNGKVIHENLALHGPTRAGMFGNEAPTGPLMFQGDHGPIAYRNLRIRRLNLD